MEYGSLSSINMLCHGSYSLSLAFSSTSCLTLIDLASEININKNYVSSIINEKVQKNFFQFVNEYRINEAKTLLSNKAYDNHSIEGIALTVGFKSKSAFNPAFKNQTGLTPSEFRKKRLQ